MAWPGWPARSAAGSYSRPRSTRPTAVRTTASGVWGSKKGLRILESVKQSSGLPILTDVHEPWQCERAAEVCDVLQVPGFLCRQTDLVVAAAETGRVVNLKKGQFMAPDDMARAAEKVQRCGNPRVVVTERGSTFGYHDLVVDMRSFEILHSHGLPVIFDVTHSVQRPGGGPQSGGARQFAEPLARAAVSAGADGFVHGSAPRSLPRPVRRHDPAPPGARLPAGAAAPPAARLARGAGLR